jgi:N-methylhydantoinase B/oxoprolinase/acetone carboxylase alpha subunit
MILALRCGVAVADSGRRGYGDPATRDPAQVRADLEDGKISAAGAKAYGAAPARTA